MNKELIDILSFYNRLHCGDEPTMLRFFMRSDAYIPEQMSFRRVSVNRKGRIVKE